MKIVIDISENIYKLIRSADNASRDFVYKADLMRAINDGVLLPKNHGRLIDADYLKDISLVHNNHVTNKNLVPYKDRKGYRMRDREVLEALMNAKTIIEPAGGDAE